MEAYPAHTHQDYENTPILVVEMLLRGKQILNKKRNRNEPEPGPGAGPAVFGG